MNYEFLAAFMLYFTSLLAIGIWFLYKNKTSDDFTIGSKSVDFWVSAIATQSSDMGTWLFMAFPAAVFIYGAKECWSAVGLLTFTFIMWHIVAHKIRTRAEETNASSLIEIFAQQCNAKENVFSITCALISVFFFVFYIAAGLVGMGRLFEAAFAIDYHAGLIIGIVTGLLYTLLGGFVAVAWSDFLQGIFLLTVIALVPWYAFGLTSWQQITTNAFNQGISLQPINSLAEFKHAIMLLFGWGLGYLGQPHILTHFMSIKNKNNIRYAKYIAVAWQAIALVASFCVGIVGIGVFANATIAQPEFIFIDLVNMMFTPFIAGIMLCAIFAATLSSMDSQILIAGTNACTDLYQKIYTKKLTSNQIINYSRYASIVISCIALAIAWHDVFSIYYLVNYAWSGLGAAFGPLTIATLLNWRLKRNHALFAIIAGTLTTALWPFVNTTVLPLLPGFMLHLSILYLCTTYKK